ncbi:unnamed protein product [Aphanomyces euteiches]|nr:hypothetical protein Ae201684P_010180 [Aphanomyces euteiches]
MKTAMTLVLAALYAVSASPLDTFSCNPLLDDVDYKSKLSVKTNQSSAEDCCKDCRNREAFCDFFVWTTENDGTCELKRFKFPLTKVDRPGVRSSVMEHCRCTDGEGCGDDGMCTGCMFGGSNGKCSKESDGACSHAGGKVCSASLTARPTGTPTDEKCRCTQGDGCTLDGACNGCLAYNNCYITDGFCTHGNGTVCGTPPFNTSSTSQPASTKPASTTAPTSTNAAPSSSAATTTSIAISGLLIFSFLASL